MAKPVLPLTDAKIRATKPGPTKIHLFDGGGLILEIKPTGARFWRFRYSFARQKREMSIAPYPTIGLGEAREKREELRRLVANGIDPMTHRESTRALAENTFEAVAREWYLCFEKSWVPKHAERIIKRLEKDIFPWLGRRPIGEIEAPELLSVLRRIQKRGAIETAHRAQVNCGQVLRFAIQTGRAKRDITQDLRGAIPPTPEKHHAAITDPAKLGAFLRAVDEYHGGIVVGSALRLMPLLVVRPGELRNMEWKDIDLESAEWRFAVSKTRREHLVPLARQSIEILQELRKITGAGRFVFLNPKTPDGSRPMSENAVLVALRTMGYTKDEVTGHGFRATFRTLGAEKCEFRIDLMEHQLAHAVRDPLGRAYNRTEFIRQRREMMQQWADYLDEIKKAEKSPRFRQGQFTEKVMES